MWWLLKPLWPTLLLTRLRWAAINVFLYFLGPYLLRKGSLGGWAQPALASSPVTLGDDKVVESGGPHKPPIRVIVVPVLSDNYAYLLVDAEKKKAAAVDPSEPHLVLAAAKREGVEIVAVLTTHNHFDHAGGNSVMVSRIPGIKVYGGRRDRVQACTHPLDHDDTVKVGNIHVRALATPGHTKGSMSYYCTKKEQTDIIPGLVFTGDTLFSGSCGKLIEGTAEELCNSLNEVLGSLPRDTHVYVGHEYTVRNLEFAVALEPGESKQLETMLDWAKRQELARKFTVPTTLQNEMLINPFMRVGDPVMSNVCPGCTPVEVFTNLRRKKDKF